MKNQSTRTVVFLVLICLSIASYAYINLHAKSQISTAPVESAQQTDEMKPDMEEGSVNLPDVRVLRTVIEAGKRILPTS